MTVMSYSAPLPGSTRPPALRRRHEPTTIARMTFVDEDQDKDTRGRQANDDRALPFEPPGLTFGASRGFGGGGEQVAVGACSGVLVGARTRLRGLCVAKRDTIGSRWRSPATSVSSCHTAYLQASRAGRRAGRRATHASRRATRAHCVHAHNDERPRLDRRGRRSQRVSPATAQRAGGLDPTPPFYTTSPGLWGLFCLVGGSGCVIASGGLVRLVVGCSPLRPCAAC